MNRSLIPPEALRQARDRFPNPDQHTVVVGVQSWRRQFGDDPDVQTLVARFPGSLSRSQVVGLTRLASQGARPVRQAFWATRMWGYGTVGYGAFRTARMLRAPDLVTYWLRAEAAVRAHDTGTVIESFGLPGCGQAFVSKFLYCLGLGAGVKPLPLILDSRVESALTALDVDLTFAAQSRTQTGPRLSLSTRRYLAYIDLVDAWAQQLACRPDQIEMCLFEGL